MLSITLHSLKSSATSTSTPPAPASRVEKSPSRWHLLSAEISFEAQSMLALYLRTTASPHAIHRDWHRATRVG